MSSEPRKYNYSRQREVIYRILAGTTAHPTAEWVWQQARRELPNLSLGTVYRNLQILEAQGRIREWTFGPQQARFDANLEPHYHFICSACEAMVDVHEPLPLDLPAAASQILGRPVMTYRLEFTGLCEACETSALSSWPERAAS